MAAQESPASGPLLKGAKTSAPLSIITVDAQASQFHDLYVTILPQVL